MNDNRDAVQAARAGRGARRLLVILVIGIAVLNLVLFLATMRKDATAPPLPSTPVQKP